MTDAIAPTGAAPAAAAAQSASNRMISSDFQTFLQMLTAQMTNQDPLNPIDSSDYAVQLATFSSVEQQVQTNDLLHSLISQLSESGISELSGWVGMEVRSAAYVSYDGEPVTLHPLPAAAADEAWLVAYDIDGNEVTRSEIGLDGEATAWDGAGDDGQPLDHGYYNFAVENYSAGTLLGTTAVEHYALVTEAQNIDGTLILVLEGDASVLASDVIGIRSPG